MYKSLLPRNVSIEQLSKTANFDSKVKAYISLKAVVM